MTEPDEALLWARDDLAKKFERFKPYISETIRNGAWDNDVAMRASVIGYRAAAAASAERIKELEARVAELEERTTMATVDLCQLLDVVKIDGHDGAHLKDDGGQNECAICATVVGIEALLKEPDQ